MLKGLYKPLGIVLGGILCIQLSVFAAEKETKKSSAPAKKNTETSPKKEAAVSKEKEAAPAK
ncbi:MAG: hypothetical protein Q6358_13030, partial [Candidatus Brocadiales bacterium]|nr:hypothetical protein [Candidatus Brocadiales bacterium]